MSTAPTQPPPSVRQDLINRKQARRDKLQRVVQSAIGAHITPSDLTPGSTAASAPTALAPDANTSPTVTPPPLQPRTIFAPPADSRPELVIDAFAWQEGGTRSGPGEEDKGSTALYL